jgi:hypothetical protein
MVAGPTCTNLSHLLHKGTHTLCEAHNAFTACSAYAFSSKKQMLSVRCGQDNPLCVQL